MTFTLVDWGEPKPSVNYALMLDAKYYLSMFLIQLNNNPVSIHLLNMLSNIAFLKRCFKLVGSGMKIYDVIGKS